MTESEFVDRIIEAIDRDLNQRGGIPYAEMDPYAQREVKAEWRRAVSSLVDDFADTRLE